MTYGQANGFADMLHIMVRYAVSDRYSLLVCPTCLLGANKTQMIFSHRSYPDNLKFLINGTQGPL